MSEFWEPWQPEIGQRVRIRLSAECNVSWCDDRYRDGHPIEADGATGTVVKDRPDPPLWGATHPYVVVFDEPIVAPLFADGRESMWHGNYFAAIELEPIA